LHDEPIAPDESNLFVGDLARGLVEEELERAFAVHGTVAAVSIKRDRATGKNLGYGFVKMSTHDEAVSAKLAMHETELHGRKVRVGWAQKNTSLFVGGLDDIVTTEALRLMFAEYGPIDEEHTYVKNGKYGFAKLKYRLHAEAARKDLNSKPVVNGHPLKVEWNNVGGTTQHHGRGGAGAAAGGGSGLGSNSPYGTRILPAHGAHSVHVQFEGEQVRAQSVVPGRSPGAAAVAAASATGGSAPSVRRRFYAFVHFPDTPEGSRGAAAAVEALNGTTFDELRVTCSF
ncbi:unnamed protein product, partial [Phaeothamnion confervicola]